jgi:hypothetical protein
MITEGYRLVNASALSDRYFQEEVNLGEVPLRVSDEAGHVDSRFR